MVTVRLDAVLDAIAPSEPAQTVSSHILLPDISPQGQEHAVALQVRIPKLELKKFDADITKWCSF